MSKKNKHIKTFNRSFPKMNRKLRRTNSPYQVKDEQVSFLLEDTEKNLEEYTKRVETKEKQLVEVKKNTAKSQK